MSKNPIPKISPPGGVFDGPVPVTLECGNPDAQIRYSTTDPNPGPGATLYEGPFEITEDAELAVKAFGGGMKNSGVARAFFDVAEPIVVGPTVTPVPDTLSPNGDVDVSAELGAWLATLPPVATIAFQPDGRYWHENILLIEHPDITIEGNGATILAKTDGAGVVPDEKHRHLWPRQRSHVEFVGDTNAVVRRLFVAGANPNAGAGDGAYVEHLEGQHAFDGRSSGTVVLEDCGAGGTYGDLLYHAGGKMIVRGGRYSGSGRQGLAVVHGEFLGEDFYLGEIGRTVVDLEPTGNQIVRSSILRGLVFGSCRHLLFNSGGAGTVLFSLMERCVVGSVGMKTRCFPSPESPEGRRRGPHHFLYNVARSAPGPQPPFRFGATDGVRVIGNVAPCPADRQKVGVSCNNCTDIAVRENDFGNAVGDLMVDGVVQ